MKPEPLSGCGSEGIDRRVVGLGLALLACHLRITLRFGFLRILAPQPCHRDRRSGSDDFALGQELGGADLVPHHTLSRRLCLGELLGVLHELPRFRRHGRQVDPRFRRGEGISGRTRADVPIQSEDVVEVRPLALRLSERLPGVNRVGNRTNELEARFLEDGQPLRADAAVHLPVGQDGEERMVGHVAAVERAGADALPEDVTPRRTSEQHFTTLEDRTAAVTADKLDARLLVGIGLEVLDDAAGAAAPIAAGNA